MKFNQKVLKTLFPDREKQRMEFRNAVALASAHCEDLSRTVGKINGKASTALKKLWNEHKPS
jgi:hypothetical protein